MIFPLLALIILLLSIGVYFVMPKKRTSRVATKSSEKEIQVEEIKKESIPFKRTPSNDLYFFYYVDGDFIKSTFEQLNKENFKVTEKEETLKGGGKIGVIGQELNGEIIRTQTLKPNELTNNEKYKMIVERLTKNNELDLEVFEPNRGIVDKDITKMEDAISFFKEQKININDTLLESISRRKDEMINDIKNQIFEKAQDGNQDGKLSLLKNFIFKIIKKTNINGDIIGFELRSEITLKDITGSIIDRMPISAFLKTTGNDTGITTQGFTFFNEIAHETIDQSGETHLTILGTVKYTRKKDLTSIHITPYVIPSS